MRHENRRESVAADEQRIDGTDLAVLGKAATGEFDLRLHPFAVAGSAQGELPALGRLRLFRLENAEDGDILDFENGAQRGAVENAADFLAQRFRRRYLDVQIQVF